VASVGSLLDAAALLLSASDFNTEENAADEIKGPVMALAYGLPSLVTIGRSAGLPIERPPRVMALLARSAEPAPDVSVRRDEYTAALDRLHPLLEVPEDQRERCWRRFAWMRSGYDDALRGLAGLTLASPAEWTTDRPATVGRPRIFTNRPIDIDWTVAVVADPSPAD
jgi:hypothetical protein